MFRKKMKCVLINIVCYFWIGAAFEMDINNFTFTEKMAMRCKKHLCRNGYLYDTFYKVDTLKSDGKDPDIALEMHIAILAARDGHILLSPTQDPQANDPVYEIVVGGGGNRFTELRRNLRRNAKQSEKTVGILSAIEERAFFIKISEDGVIEFGREGDKLPMISFKDNDPLTINYFSFAAWNGVEAKFWYDCPRPGGNETAPDSQEVEPNMSSSDRLKQALLKDKPNHPSILHEYLAVDIGVRVTSVKFNALEGKVTTGLAVVLSWSDESMAWNPTKFNGTTRLTFRLGQIWTPVLFSFNSDDAEILNIWNPGLISMIYNGDAVFHFYTQVTSFCNESLISEYNKWPHDRWICTILLGPLEVHQTIALRLIPENDQKMAVFAGIDEIIKNEWEISTPQIDLIPKRIWEYLSKSYANDMLVINLILERNATIYNIAFYTPLLILVTFVLLSFWSPPLEMSRVWFYAGTTVVICMGISYMDYLVPCVKVPSVLVLYTVVMMGVLIALLIQVILMTSLMETICKSSAVQTVLTGKWFRLVFCLPAVKTCKNYDSINEGYNDDDGDAESIMTRQNVEEMQSEATTYGEKVELGEAIDKLMFFIYSVVFCVMLAMHY